MAHLKDRTGKRYGRLVVVRATNERTASRNVIWECRCDCGATAFVSSGSLGLSTRSCGCLQRELLSEKQTTHGLTKTAGGLRALVAYHHAKSRCTNPSDKRFNRYGGRGITICKEWLGNPTQFVRDMGECPPGMTLERLDVDGPYAPSNCVWATKKQQARNKSTVIKIEDGNGYLTLREYAAKMGVNYNALKTRVRRTGLSPEVLAKAMIETPRKRITPFKDRPRDENGRFL